MTFRIPAMAIVLLIVLCPLTDSAEESNSAEVLIEQAKNAADRDDHSKAIEIAARAIEIDAKAADAYYLRGREHFRIAKIDKSVSDFDRYVELRPEAEPRQWERGIACFYAGMYEKGARQFEFYQKHDGEDVENSVWRYLCLVPQIGVEKAKMTMLPIQKDRRIPMMKIYDLYRGVATTDDVIAEVKMNSQDREASAASMFYANLYIGLWFDAQGERDRAMKHIELAADDHLKSNPRLNRYMWDVARIHQLLLRGELEKAKRP